MQGCVEESHIKNTLKDDSEFVGMVIRNKGY